VRELTRITAIGSCRISTPFKSAPASYPVINNTDRIYGYTHSSAEALQQIKFLQSDFTPAPELLPLLMPNTDHEALAAKTHITSDIYFVELSSAKELEIDGVQVQLNYLTRHFADFFSETTRARDFWRLVDGKQEAAKQAYLDAQESFRSLDQTDREILRRLTRKMTTPASLQQDMREIRERLPNVVFVTHCNALTNTNTPIASRSAYIEMVNEVAQDLGVPCFDPTVSMQAFGQHAALSDPNSSLSHYVPEFGDFLFDGLFSRYIAPTDNQSVLSASDAISKAVELYQDRTPIVSISPKIGGVAFITGSLGAGGAERQMTRLAVEMQLGQSDGSASVNGPIEVYVSNLSTERDRDFFLPVLQDAKIPVSTISSLPSLATDNDSLPPRLKHLLPFLPPQTTEAIHRLAPHLARTRPEVAYIWQDGAVLTAALAALVADVPRIVISLRGMPPDMRPEMMREGYFDLYLALAETPGVTFSANTHAGADAYARWLGLPQDSIHVVHNAADTICATGCESDTARWREFETSTADSDFTFGGVFRFDQNKRPMMWLEFVAAALVVHPQSRFILVGDGAGFDAAKNYAEELGIAHRCLFTGKSKNVGYWLSKMDALGLLSRLEGLPNVLIEAQLSGIPVISTPAGGAAEAFLPNQTGFLLGSTENPQLAEFLRFYIALSGDQKRRAQMGRNACAFAGQSFAMETILPQTLELLSDTTRPAELPKSVAFA